MDQSVQIKDNWIRFRQERISKIGYFKKTVAFVIFFFLMLYVTLCIWLVLCKYLHKIYYSEKGIALFEIFMIEISTWASYTISDMLYCFNFQLNKKHLSAWIGGISIIIILITNVSLYSKKDLISSVGYFDVSIDSILISCCLILCLNVVIIWLTRTKIFFPPLIINIKNQKNMYINSTGQICISNKLGKNSTFKLQIEQIKNGDYEYKYLGFIPQRVLRRTKCKKEKIYEQAKDQKDTSFQLLKEIGHPYYIRINDFIKSYKSPLGLTENMFSVVIEYKETEKKEIHCLIENVLLIDELSERENKDYIQDSEETNNWVLSQLIIPFIYSAGLSFFITAIYLTFHKWFEFKLLQLPELQICLDLKDKSESNSVYVCIIIGFLCIYASLIMKYILQMVNLKDGITREQKYHNYVLKVIEGALLILPVLLLQDQSLSYDSNGYLQLNSNLILSVWIIVAWMFFNIIKGISLLKRWIMKDKDSGEKYPRTYLLLAIITFLVGLLFRGK